ncbi:MAG: nucleotidyltransferase family protein [Acetatifactor sp.]|nr:nucleotidyltransferase family protein [Acetatifactor sp.]
MRDVNKNGIENQKQTFSQEENCLLALLREALTGVSQEPVGSLDWERLIHMAERHGVLPLLYDALTGRPEVPPNPGRRAADSARQTVQQSYRLLFLCKYLMTGLERAGVSVALLKGVGTAAFYSTPELRKAGDVDIMLLRPEELPRAEKVLSELGCRRMQEQSALHHVAYQSDGGIEVELHTMLAEPFDNERMNQYLRECLPDCAEHVRRADVMGVELPVLEDAWHAYELLLHMLQHFLRSGFGLKLLCDWVVFWNRDTDSGEREQYLKLVTESRVKGFSDMVTLVCCRYLGLPKERVAWMQLSEDYAAEQFLAEILEAEEFGKSSANRMVTLRGGGLKDYVREFHHQMCLNFPKGSRCILCWPVLWLITLLRFLRNNRKIRKTSGLAILKKAGQRGKMIEQIGLFR